MGFFSELFDIFNDMREDVCDIVEYATVGFVEEVVKGNGEYKTSYERRDEANAIYAAANRRLKDAAESLNRTVEELNGKICDLNARKQRLLNGMCRDIPTASPDLRTSYASSGFSSSFNGLSTSSNLIAACIRSSMADDYLEDARDHRAECDAKIACINHRKVCLDAVDMVLGEEARLLDILEQSRGFRYSKDSAAIAEQLRQLLTQHICNVDGELDSNYARSIEALKVLCRSL